MNTEGIDRSSFAGLLLSSTLDGAFAGGGKGAAIAAGVSTAAGFIGV